MKTFLDKFCVPILVVLFGTLGASLFFLQYTQPQVVYYTDGYFQKTGEFSVGEVYFVNEGGSTAEDVTMVINAEIPRGNFDVAYSNSPYKTEIINHQTFFTLEHLKPRGDAEVTFRMKANSPNFVIENVFSKLGGIEKRGWINPWWYFSKWQIGFMILVSAISYSVGYLIKLKNAQKKL